MLPVVRCGSIHFCVCGCERQSADSFVCFDVKPTQRAWGQDFLKKTRKSKVPVKSTDSRGKATVRGRRLLSEELGPVNPEAGSVSTRG